MNYLKECYVATGSHVAGGLLQRIIYWFPMARQKWHGKEWQANTVKDWCEETGYTPKMVKDAITKLRDLGIIETCYHLWNNKRTTFLRLIDPKRWDLKVPGDEYQKGLTKKTSEGPTLNTEILQEIQQDNLLASEQENGPMDKPENPGKKVNKPNQFKVPGGTVSDIKTMFSEAQSKPKEDKSPPDLKILWQKLMKEHTGVLYSMTMAELGQLKHAKKKLPAEKAIEILTYAIENWISFVEEVKFDNGWKHGPTVPSVGYLLKHANTAHSLWHRKTQKAKISTIPSPEVPTGPKKPKKVSW